MTNSIDNTSEFLKAATATLKSIGLSEDFFQELFAQGNDWTFIIKSHALLESAITHLIVADLERNELAPLIANLEMSNTRVGKVAFAKELRLLNKDYRAFLRNLSELRNQLVHDIRNTAFTFQKHNTDLSKIVKKCIKSSSLMLKEEIDISGKKIAREKFSNENPRFSILIAILSILSSIYNAVGIEDPLLRRLIRIERQRQFYKGK
jgi:hypothetical protein